MEKIFNAVNTGVESNINHASRKLAAKYGKHYVFQKEVILYRKVWLARFCKKLKDAATVEFFLIFGAASTRST